MTNEEIINELLKTSIIIPSTFTVCQEAVRCIREIVAENEIIREFKNRAERDFTEADKMFIHIEDVKQNLRVKRFEE